jgi:hypothetical protein
MEIVAPRDGLVGVDHIAHLGDASSSLGLIATLVFSLAISCLLEFELTGHWANLMVAMFLITACATSAFVMSLALLETPPANPQSPEKDRHNSAVGISP